MEEDVAGGMDRKVWDRWGGGKFFGVAKAEGDEDRDEVGEIGPLAKVMEAVCALLRLFRLNSLGRFFVFYLFLMIGRDEKRAKKNRSVFVCFLRKNQPNLEIYWIQN